MWGQKKAEAKLKNDHIRWPMLLLLLEGASDNNFIYAARKF